MNFKRKNKSIFKDETLSDIVQYCGSQEELIEKSISKLNKTNVK